jgi:hypothetical protein
MYRNIPPPPQANAGNTVLKIVLIVVGLFVLLGVIVAGVIGVGVYKFSKGLHKNSDGGVSLSTPGGTVTTGKGANISAADLGTELYPGAVSSDGSMNMKTPTGSVVTAVYTSSDSPDKIVAFYKDNLGDLSSLVQTSDGSVLSKGANEKDKITVTVTPEAGVSKIVIIHVTRTGP